MYIERFRYFFLMILILYGIINIYVNLKIFIGYFCVSLI